LDFFKLFIFFLGNFDRGAIKKVRIEKICPKTSTLYVYFEGEVNGDNFKGKINFLDGVYEGESIYLIKNGQGKFILREEAVKSLGGM
jgi:hypothetical protein